MKDFTGEYVAAAEAARLHGSESRIEKSKKNMRGFLILRERMQVANEAL
jgi:hypothetical protein